MISRDSKCPHFCDVEARTKGAKRVGGRATIIQRRELPSVFRLPEASGYATVSFAR
jgi:hypothetical protein